MGHKAQMGYLKSLDKNGPFRPIYVDWARFGLNGPVRSVFHETETETSIFTSYLLISYFWYSLIRFRTMRNRTNPYYFIRSRPIGLVLSQMGPLDRFFTKLKLKLLFSHHIYTFHNFGIPWSGSELCATVQINTILYDVGPLGSFWPKWAR